MARSKLVIASGNQGKLAEFEDMLEPRGFEVHPQSEFGVEPPPETGGTFVENALIKARAAAEASGHAALGDDSGLVVDILEGRPGIRSARYAGDNADDEANIDKLLAELEDMPADRRGAVFYCCLVLLRHADDPAPLIATGRWRGYILEERRGDRGVTAAEMPAGEKNRISHRGQALEKLIGQIKEGRV